MNTDEYQQIIAHTRQLWTGWQPTAAQLDVLYEQVRRHDAKALRWAVETAFASQDRPTRDAPLGAIIRLFQRDGTPSADRVTDDERLTSRLAFEQAEMAAAFKGWTYGKFADCKAAILEHEPHLRAVLADLPVASDWWLALIFERFVRGAARVRLSDGRWTDVPLAEYWAARPARPARQPGEPQADPQTVQAARDALRGT